MSVPLEAPFERMSGVFKRTEPEIFLVATSMRRFSSVLSHLSVIPADYLTIIKVLIRWVTGVTPCSSSSVLGFASSRDSAVFSGE